MPVTRCAASNNLIIVDIMMITGAAHNDTMLVRNYDDGAKNSNRRALEPVNTLAFEIRYKEIRKPAVICRSDKSTELCLNVPSKGS